MLLTAIFLVVWLLVTLALRALLQRLAPSVAQKRGALLAVGVLALAIAYPLVQRIERSSPARIPAEARWPEHARVPPPRRVQTRLLARLPFTTVHGDALAPRATFVEASRRRPVALMALRLAEETTRQVQRYLALHGDTLELIVDERRRPDGEGTLYALPLAEVVLAACRGDDCRPVPADTLLPEGTRYRILGRFQGDTTYAVRF